MMAALEALVAAVEAALADPELADDRSRVQAMEPAMADLLADAEPIPASGYESFEGEAVGNVLYSDPDGRFHVMAVVFPEGTSSGVHHHGCWGLIGYLRGGDEETRYWGSTPSDAEIELDEASRHVWRQGDITYLLPEEGEGWHRVRNSGPGTGVSVHVLCMTPRMHPHHYWDRDTRHAVSFGFVEVAPGRWQAQLGG